MKKRDYTRILQEGAAGSYYAIIQWDRQEDTREFEVVHGPVQLVVDYAAKLAAEFDINNMGADMMFFLFPVSPRIANALSDTDQKVIDETVEDIMEYREAIFSLDACNASDWVLDFIEDTEDDPDAITDADDFDIDEYNEKPEYKTWAIETFKEHISRSFRAYTDF